MVNIKWRASFSASALHAAYRIAIGEKGTASELRTSMLGAAEQLHSLIVELLDVRAANGWRLLIAFGAEIENNTALAERWLSRLGFQASVGSRVVRLAGAISDVEAVMRTTYPKLLEQLELRGRPIQEQWLGYGRGLTAHLRRLTEPNWLLEDVEGILLQPTVGGAGIAHSQVNRFSIEAVLTNPLPELPEVVRVAWLVAQLQSDLPMYADELGPDRAQPIAALASLMAVLAAAEVLELSRCDEAMIQLAVEHWQIAIPAMEDITTILIPWWETHLQTRPPWSIALKALDKMLEQK